MDETLTLPILVNSSSVREMVNDKTKSIKFHNTNSNNNDLRNDTIKYKEHTMDSSITQTKDIPMMNEDENENYKRRWGIPIECRLRGGGENTINSNNPGWNSSSPNASTVNAQNTPNNNNSNNQNTPSSALSGNTNNAWSSGRPNTANTNQSSSNASHQTTTSQNNTGKGGNNAGNQNSSNSQNQQAQQATTAGANPTSWAQAAGKNLTTAAPASPGNSNAAPASPGNNGSGNSNGNGGGSNGNGTPTAKQQIDQINTMREAIYSAEGWGGQHVNQDSEWDVPASPEPSAVVKEGNPPTAFPFKPNVNNGTDLWEANLRNGGQPPPQPTQKAPWGHTPTNNIGGTWGEPDDVESSNVWTGTPNTNTNPSVQQWGNVQQNAGIQMWGGNKKDEWGNVGNNNWNDPRDMSRGGNGMDSRSNMVDGSHMRNIDPHRNLTNEMMRAAPGGGITGRLNGSVDPMWGPPPQQQSGPGPHHHLSQGGSPNVAPVSSKLGPQGQSASHWKDMGGGNNLGRGGMQCMPGGPNIPQNRIAPGNGLNNSAGGPGVMKQDQQLWGHPAARNGSWGDGTHDVGPWGDDKMTPWNEQSWTGQKAKNLMASGGWGDGEVDSSWNHPNKMGQKALTKEIIWASKQFRILTEMNFKKEDVEIALRASNMVVEDALEFLNSGRNENWRRPNDMDPNLFDHNGRYNPNAQQMFSVQQGLRGLQQSSMQPTPQQLRVLVQQIQIAVQTGYLNHQILNQPLAPPTLLLLTQLLQQIKILQQLGHQYNVLQGQLPIGSKSSAAMMNLSQQMQNIKKQIAQLQQAMLMKQQQSQHNNMNTMQHQQQTNMADYFKNQDQMSLLQSFNELSMSKEQQMAGTYQAQQSRLNQWKLPSLDKDELGSGNEFSRAPGSTPKTNSGTGSPNLNPILGQGDGTWSSATTQSGWPDALSESEGKDWPGQAATNTNFTDLVPEFEPGKPWKGSQLKNIEDDPTITPGSVVRSPLSLAAIKDSDNIFSQSQSGGGKTSPSNVEIPLASSTWAFNPSAAASFTSPVSKFNNAANTTKQGGTAGWADTNDLWSVTKARGPPPGLTNNNKNAGAITTNGWSGLSSPRWPNNPSTQSWVGSSWLLLRNLTPQIDASTLKTLCVQHGPLQNFHISLNHGIAFAKYSTREEAAKAQNALNNCMLGNTTIFVESPSESDVHALLQQLGGGSQMNADTWGSAGGVNNNASSQLWPSTFWGGPSTPIENADAHRTTPSSSLNSFLPGDLLGGEPI